MFDGESTYDPELPPELAPKLPRGPNGLVHSAAGRLDRLDALLSCTQHDVGGDGTVVRGRMVEVEVRV